MVVMMLLLLVMFCCCIIIQLLLQIVVLIIELLIILSRNRVFLLISLCGSGKMFLMVFLVRIGLLVVICFRIGVKVGFGKVFELVILVIGGRVVLLVLCILMVWGWFGLWCRQFLCFRVCSWCVIEDVDVRLMVLLIFWMFGGYLWLVIDVWMMLRIVCCCLVSVEFVDSIWLFVLVVLLVIEVLLLLFMVMNVVVFVLRIKYVFDRCVLVVGGYEEWLGFCVGSLVLIEMCWWCGLLFCVCDMF